MPKIPHPIAGRALTRSVLEANSNNDHAPHHQRAMLSLEAIVRIVEYYHGLDDGATKVEIAARSACQAHMICQPVIHTVKLRYLGGASPKTQWYWPPLLHMVSTIGRQT